MSTVLPTRELYCPGHFGNTYEVALPGEMDQILAEAKSWGFNRYSDWFDTIDLQSIYNPGRRLYNLPEAMWEHKLSNFALAARRGFDLGLVVTPNHVFADQVTAANAAELGEHIFGHLVCPHKPGVVEMILENYRRLFGDFAARNLQLRALSGGAYDYGGCACAACRPWIVTFGKLLRQIAGVAREFFPDIQLDLWGWWWSADDHRDFTAWADAEAPGEFSALAFHLPYGRTDYTPAPIPTGCRERAFVHIAYGEASNRDAYGHYGPPIAPRRLETTCQALCRRGADGFLAYSEGDYDELNKAVLAGLSSGQYRTATEVLQAYAARHFGNDPAGWAELLFDLGDYFTIDPARVQRRFDALADQARPGWRVEQLRERIAMAQADAEVRRHQSWTPARIQAAQAFWQAKERLFRHIWRLGLMRHGFRFYNNAPDWDEEFARITGRGDFRRTGPRHAEA